MSRAARVLRENWLPPAIVAALATAFLTLRSQPTRLVSLDESLALVQRGQPSVAEFYSNY